VRLGLPPDADLTLLSSDADVEELLQVDGGVEVALRQDAELSRFVARTFASLPVDAVSSERARLHDLFIRAVKQDDERRAEGIG
jgi:hypothetical protein